MFKFQDTRQIKFVSFLKTRHYPKLFQAFSFLLNSLSRRLSQNMPNKTKNNYIRVVVICALLVDRRNIRSILFYNASKTTITFVPKSIHC